MILGSPLMKKYDTRVLNRFKVSSLINDARCIPQAKFQGQHSLIEKFKVSIRAMIKNP